MAVAVNHHLTTAGRFGLLRESMVLRFVVFGAMSYTAVSFQGSLESLRGFQEVAHFTHYTIGHAHLGVHAFLSMILFGAMYYITPRVARWEWSRPGLIKWHFWLAATGVLIYVVALCTGGWLQGLRMNQASRAFTTVVDLTRPYLIARTVGGSLMGVGHLIFAYLFVLVLFRKGPRRQAAPSPEGGGGP
jgi:cytochrome c oxidase cbb3-type subunit 1